MTAPLDFWNYPDWLGDSRDNPRDPNYEPFWMRPATSEDDSQKYRHMLNTPETVCSACGAEWFSTDGKCHMCRRGVEMRPAFMRLPDGNYYRIKTFSVDCN